MSIKDVKPILKDKAVKNHTCPWWVCYSFDNPLRRLVQNPKKILSPLVQPGMTVFDIGCGMGYFSIALAQLVGAEGKVIAVDLQDKMLERVVKRANRAGVSDRIVTHPGEITDFGPDISADFILSFWMVHEVRNHDAFFSGVRNLLSTEGSFFVAEPLFHVSGNRFEFQITEAESHGLIVRDRPRVSLSRAVLFGPAK